MLISQLTLKCSGNLKVSIFLTGGELKSFCYIGLVEQASCLSFTVGARCNVPLPYQTGMSNLPVVPP
jgi:hypothetical protein